MWRIEPNLHGGQNWNRTREDVGRGEADQSGNDEADQAIFEEWLIGVHL